jgi:hypothetical protein
MVKVSRRRDGDKEQFWREVFERRERSGLSVRAFCDREGLAESTYYRWLAELHRCNAKGVTGSAPSIFAPVTVTESTSLSSSSSIEIVVGESWRVRVNSGFDASVLEAVLNVLESRRC